MKSEEGLSEFMKFAYKCNKVRDIKEAFEEWLNTMNEGEQSKVASSKVIIC